MRFRVWQAPYRCLRLMDVFASFGGIVGPMAVGSVAQGGSTASSFYMLGYSLFVSALVMCC